MFEQGDAEERQDRAGGTESQQRDRNDQVGKMVPLAVRQDVQQGYLESEQGCRDQQKCQVSAAKRVHHSSFARVKGTKRTGIRLVE